eukprot:sb/3466338/
MEYIVGADLSIRLQEVESFTQHVEPVTSPQCSTKPTTTAAPSTPTVFINKTVPNRITVLTAGTQTPHSRSQTTAASQTPFKTISWLQTGTTTATQTPSRNCSSEGTTFSTGHSIPCAQVNRWIRTLSTSPVATPTHLLKTNSVIAPSSKQSTAMETETDIETTGNSLPYNERLALLEFTGLSPVKQPNPPTTITPVKPSNLCVTEELTDQRPVPLDKPQGETKKTKPGRKERLAERKKRQQSEEVAQKSEIQPVRQPVKQKESADKKPPLVASPKKCELDQWLSPRKKLKLTPKKASVVLLRSSRRNTIASRVSDDLPSQHSEWVIRVVASGMIVRLLGSRVVE